MAGLTMILLGRLALLTGSLALLAVLLPGDSLAFFGLMALAYTVTIPYALWLKNNSRYARYVPLQFVVDLVVVTGLVYFTGGLTSDFVLLYPLVILASGIAAGPKRAVEITVLCMTSYLTLVVLLWQGVLVSYGGSDAMAPVWPGAAETVGVRLVVFALFGAASVYLSQRCTYVDRNLARFREMAEMVFRHLPAGLMVVDESDRVLMVNDRAAAMLDFPPAALTGRSLDNILHVGIAEIDDEMGDGSTVKYLARSDGRKIPVHVDAAPLDWSPKLMNPDAAGGPRRIRILAVTDISALLELQRGIKEAVRARTIGAMASEIAHEIRNPIAAISGSVQLLDKLERGSGRGNARCDELLAAEKGSLYECIVSESDRLGRVIEKFVDYSEFSMDKLRGLLAMPELHTRDLTNDGGLSESDHTS